MACSVIFKFIAAFLVGADAGGPSSASGRSASRSASRSSWSGEEAWRRDGTKWWNDQAREDSEHSWGGDSWWGRGGDWKQRGDRERSQRGGWHDDAGSDSSWNHVNRPY